MASAPIFTFNSSLEAIICNWNENGNFPASVSCSSHFRVLHKNDETHVEQWNSVKRAEKRVFPSHKKHPHSLHRTQSSLHNSLLRSKENVRLGEVSLANENLVYNSDYLSGLSINEPNSPNQIFLFQWKIIRNRCNYVENHVKLCLRIGLFVWGRKISFCASNYDFSRFIFSCRTNFPFLCQQAAVMWIYEFMTNLGTLGKSKNINEGKFRKAILKMDENSNSIILINLIFLIPRPHIQSTLVSLMSESSRFMDFPYDFMNNVMLCAFEQSE